METDIKRNPYSEWLDYVKPVGLVISPKIMEDLELVPAKLTATDSSLVEELLNSDENECAISDVWAFMEKVLGWQEEFVAGTPNGPALNNEVKVLIPDLGITLSPDWAVVLEEDGKPKCQLMVKLHSDIDDLDLRGQISGWEETPQKQFERLLRDSKFHAGLLVAKKEIRLVYAPTGETSGYISFPIRPLATVAGRPVLAGLKLVLESFRLIGDEKSRRLPAILEASRKAQTEVSTELANQVLGALHELLRGFYSADSDRIVQLARDEPEHLYDGLLTILMRLVFILYAEDRNLLPSSENQRDKEIFDSSYSLRGLFTRLREDESFNPDTMDERSGAWGQLLALFRMIHSGYPNDEDVELPFVKSRGGKLFNPDEFLFIEGRLDIKDKTRILNITDGCILRILTDLMTLKRKRQIRELLSYRTLDVEQIGSVYETVMGFTVELANDQMIAIMAGKNNNTPVFVGLNNILECAGKTRFKYIKEETDRQLDSKTKLYENVENAQNVEDLKFALDPIVDVRGSPYHSIIEKGSPILQPTDERRKTGSHYTPRELTEPIVKHALEPIIERLGDKPKPSEILELKVCDPAMGSGAFLVEVCRALGKVLVKSWKNWPDEKLSHQSDEDEENFARRLIATNCIYGVDRNSRAVDLAKLSLWLATLAKTEEFTFLDHSLKCGDSLVGLTIEQIKDLTWEKSKVSSSIYLDPIYKKVDNIVKIRKDIRVKAHFTSVSELDRKNRAIISELSDIRDLGDAVISIFFQSDKEKDRDLLKVDLKAWYAGDEPNFQKIRDNAKNFRSGELSFFPFHWELEFPEVFFGEKNGFDIIVGNPPFAGKNNISNANPKYYLKWLLHIHDGSNGNSDLVAHFFRKSFTLLNEEGVAGLIATSTISEGDTRSSGLTQILSENGSIFRALTRVKWPGVINILVTIVHFKRGVACKPTLNGKSVKRISAYLLDGYFDETPVPILSYEKRAFQGVITLGNGFIFDDNGSQKGECESIDSMKSLLIKNPKNKKAIFPYIGGEEVNSSPTQAFHRYVINFGEQPLYRDDTLKSWNLFESHEREELVKDGIVPFDYPGEVAHDWPDLIKIVQNRVKPFRDKHQERVVREKWWLYKRNTPALTKAIENLESVYALSLTTKHIALAKLPSNYVFSCKLGIFAFEKFSPFSILQSRIHDIWARFFSSTMGSVIAYTISDCFDTFPFPQSYEEFNSLELIGKKYYDFRANLMIELNDGLTKIYNRFHDEKEKDPRIEELRRLHCEMDHEVLIAYGWEDLIGSAYPEFIDKNSDEGKSTTAWLDWPPKMRFEILDRLLHRNKELTVFQKNKKSNELRKLEELELYKTQFPQKQSEINNR